MKKNAKFTKVMVIGEVGSQLCVEVDFYASWDGDVEQGLIEKACEDNLQITGIILLQIEQLRAQVNKAIQGSVERNIAVDGVGVNLFCDWYEVWNDEDFAVDLEYAQFECEMEEYDLSNEASEWRRFALSICEPCLSYDSMLDLFEVPKEYR